MWLSGVCHKGDASWQGLGLIRGLDGGRELLATCGRERNCRQDAHLGFWSRGAPGVVTCFISDNEQERSFGFKGLRVMTAFLKMSLVCEVHCPYHLSHRVL